MEEKRGAEVKKVTLKAIQLATQGFAKSNLMGDQGYGRMYKVRTQGSELNVQECARSQPYVMRIPSNSKQSGFTGILVREYRVVRKEEATEWPANSCRYFSLCR